MTKSYSENHDTKDCRAKVSEFDPRLASDFLARECIVLARDVKVLGNESVRLGGSDSSFGVAKKA